MKMYNDPDLMDIVTKWIAAHRLEFGYGGIAGIIVWLRGRDNEKPWRRCFLDVLMCAAIAFAVRALLIFSGSIALRCRQVICCFFYDVACPCL